MSKHRNLELEIHVGDNDEVLKLRKLRHVEVTAGASLQGVRTGLPQSNLKTALTKSVMLFLL